MDFVIGAATFMMGVLVGAAISKRNDDIEKPKDKT